MRISNKAVAGFAAVSSLGGLTAGAACCVLPVALGAIGISASALSPLVPYHEPLSVMALVVVAAGWVLFLRRRRTCASGADCAPPSGSTLALLIMASLLVGLSALWPSIETPLMDVIR